MMPTVCAYVRRMDTAEAFDAQQVRGQSGTITAVVNALAKAGIELGENGSVIPGRGKPTAFRMDGKMSRCSVYGSLTIFTDFGGSEIIPEQTPTVPVKMPLAGTLFLP